MNFTNKLKQRLLKEITGKSNWFWAVIIVTALVDYLNTKFYYKTESFFHNIIDGKNNNAIFFLIGIYCLLIIVIIFTGLMSSYKTQKYHNRKQQGIKKLTEALFVIMIIGFGIILMMPSINILGLGIEETNLSDNQQYTYMMILLGFIFALIILPFISFKPKFHLGDFNYLLVYIPVIIVVYLTINFSTAIWKFSFLNSDGLVDTNRPSRIIEFIAIFPFYAMFFSAPRFILLRKSVSVFTLLSALASTAYFVWQSLEYMEI